MTTTLMIVHAWAQLRGITEEEAAEQIKELLIYGSRRESPGNEKQIRDSW